MAKVVVVEFGFQEDGDAEDFADGISKGEHWDDLPKDYDIIETKVEDV